MNCRCAERTEALRRAASDIRRGDTAAAGRELRETARTLVEDARSGALRQAATAQLARWAGRGSPR